MLYLDFLDAVRGVPGVIDAVPLGRAMASRICDVEDGLVRGASGFRMENAGMNACASQDSLFVMFCDSDYDRGSEVSIEMVDDRGVTVGHDVPEAMRPQFADRGDVVWIADNFVMFPDRLGPCDARMVMKAVRPDWSAGMDVSPRTFLPSMESAMMLKGAYGYDDPMVSAVVLGVSGLEACPSSVPVSDVVEVPCAGCGHGESASQDPLYRCDLVGEPLEVLQPPFADQDLHALVVVEMDVDGHVHQAWVVVLHVGDLVPDRRHRMVVDDDDGADHPLLLVLPLGFRQGVAHEVPYRLGAADIALLRDRFVELL